MITKMVAAYFDTVIIEKHFIRQERKLNKIINGLRFRFILGVSAFSIPNSTNSQQNAIILFTIDALTTLIVKLISSFKRNKLLIERSEFPKFYLNNWHFRGVLYEYFVLSWQYKLFDGLFLMTDELVNFYKKFTKGKCIIQKVPMTVDFSRFGNHSNYNGRPYLFYAGSLSEQKDGVESLIRAFRKVSDSHTDLDLVIAGKSKNGIHESNLKKLISSNNLTGRVILLGSVDSKRIPQYMIDSKILVLPRPDSIQARGGFPTKLGEYLASGKPVIVTRVGEIPKLLSYKEVFFISPDNIVNELADKINLILSDYEAALYVGHRGEKIARKMFDIKANQILLKNGIERVFNPNRSSLWKVIQ